MERNLRRFLEDASGGTPREDILSYLERTGKARLLSSGEKGEEELIQEYQELEAQFPSDEQPTVVTIPGDRRCEALSRILALETARREDVVEFRRSHLKGKLLKADSVSSWVKAHGKPESRERKPKRDFRVSESPSPMVPSSQYKPHRLYYYDPPSDTVRSAPLHRGSPLAELKVIAASICEVHTVWTEPDVTTFILTADPPPVPLARIELEKNALWPAENRARIIIDPGIITQIPAKVLSEVRDALIPVGQKRTKALSKKHLELGVVGEVRRGERDKPWAVLLSEWNVEHPEWAYEGRTAEVHFSRDVRSAWCRVTGRTWV